MANWLRRLFSSAPREEEAAEYEEYGPSDRVDVEPRRSELGSFAGAEGAEAAEEELEEFEPPRDPAP